MCNVHYVKYNIKLIYSPTFNSSTFLFFYFFYFFYFYFFYFFYFYFFYAVAVNQLRTH